MLQARILEWVAFPFSKGSSQPRYRIQVSHTAGVFFARWATREAQGKLRQTSFKRLLLCLCEDRHSGGRSAWNTRGLVGIYNQASELGVVDGTSCEEILRVTVYSGSTNLMRRCYVASVVSDFVWPCILQSAMLLCPWDYPGKNTGVGCSLLQRVILTTGKELRSLKSNLHWQESSLPLAPSGKPNLEIDRLV